MHPLFRLSRRVLALATLTLAALAACGSDSSSQDAELTGPLGAVCCDDPANKRCYCGGNFRGKDVCELDNQRHWVKAESCTQTRDYVPSTTYAGCAEGQQNECKLNKTDTTYTGLLVTCAQGTVPAGCGVEAELGDYNLLCCPGKS